MIKEEEERHPTQAVLRGSGKQIYFPNNFYSFANDEHPPQK